MSETTTDTERLVNVIRRLYSLDGCEMGGPLHIVTDDLNVEDHHIRWCRDTMDSWFDEWYDGNEEKEARLLALIIIGLLFKLPVGERGAVIMRAHRLD